MSSLRVKFAEGPWIVAAAAECCASLNAFKFTGASMSFVSSKGDVLVRKYFS